LAPQHKEVKQHQIACLTKLQMTDKVSNDWQSYQTRTSRYPFCLWPV